MGKKKKEKKKEKKLAKLPKAAPKSPASKSKPSAKKPSPAKPSKPGKTAKLIKKKKKEERTIASGKGVLRKSAPGPMPTRPAPVKLTREMQEIRSRLTTMLADMRRDIDHEVRGASERDLAHINDTSDMASDAAEGDLALRIAESETVEASEIERALEKIDNGTYGVCEMCSTPIGADRLKFLPYVTLCIKCQELAEIRRREESNELDDLAEGSEMDSENN
jgi:RNA polymerase-binding protein DksA